MKLIQIGWTTYNAESFLRIEEGMPEIVRDASGAETRRTPRSFKVYFRGSEREPAVVPVDQKELLIRALTGDEGPIPFVREFIPGE